MPQNLLQSEGGHAQKETRFVSLFTSRFLTGYFSNRSFLRGPLQSLYSDFYHIGTTDALCDGLNWAEPIEERGDAMGNESFNARTVAH